MKASTMFIEEQAGVFKKSYLILIDTRMSEIYV